MIYNNALALIHSSDRYMQEETGTNFTVAFPTSPKKQKGTFYNLYDLMYFKASIPVRTLSRAVCIGEGIFYMDC